MRQVSPHSKQALSGHGYWDWLGLVESLDKSTDSLSDFRNQGKCMPGQIAESDSILQHCHSTLVKLLKLRVPSIANGLKDKLSKNNFENQVHLSEAALAGLPTSYSSAEEKLFNVQSYGAKADGKTDNSKAFLSTWKDACQWNGTSKFLIPSGEYMVYAAIFIGPCSGSMTFQIQGVVKAPTDPSLFCNSTWISFQYVNGLEIEGGGTLDGQGASAWPYFDTSKNSNCPTLPVILKLDFIKNAVVHDIHSINSKSFHFDLFMCNNVTFSHVNLTAPGDSPNTDGIHMGVSTNIQVLDSNIGTGDDCISMINGSQSINISGITCGPGHGISIGSLGKTQNEVVTDIHD
nr:exopolygalacturonase-like [Nicotiana tomentosiformis]